MSGRRRGRDFTNRSLRAVNEPIHAVWTEAGGDRVLTISEDSGLFTTMIFVEVPPGKQKEVSEASVPAIVEKIRHLPDFAATVSHNSLDGKMVTEYAQWESEDHFGEASHTPRVMKWMKRAT
jgi:hypothetical protein